MTRQATLTAVLAVATLFTAAAVVSADSRFDRDDRFDRRDDDRRDRFDRRDRDYRRDDAPRVVVTPRTTVVRHVPTHTPTVVVRRGTQYVRTPVTVCPTPTPVYTAPRRDPHEAYGHGHGHGHTAFIVLNVNAPYYRTVPEDRGDAIGWLSCGTRLQVYGIGHTWYRAYLHGRLVYIHKANARLISH